MISSPDADHLMDSAPKLHSGPKGQEVWFFFSFFFGTNIQKRFKEAGLT